MSVTRLDETALRQIVMDVILESAQAELDEKYGKMTPAQARKRLSSIEKKYGKTFKSKLQAFSWASDPSAAMAALMRKAGKDPRGD